MRHEKKLSEAYSSPRVIAEDSHEGAEDGGEMMRIRVER